jgi:leucine-rich PPR motif-containing protein
MATFEEAAEKYHCTPWKTELTVRLINDEDADRLQKVVDLSTKIHGEVNSLYDLVFCFLETGRTRQARRILEVSECSISLPKRFVRLVLGL